jgi:hypothetical protein
VSRKILEEIDNLARQTAIDACWRQWSALGALVSSISPRRLAGMIDPEALLLLTAAYREQERRLNDVISWWASVGSTLLSVQRLRSLSSRFPEDHRCGISGFAQTAYEQGDRRWRKFGVGPAEKPPGRLKGTRHPVLGEPASVLLRLRAGFGVGVKSDLFAVLLGMGRSTVTVRMMVDALGYSRAAITVAAREMAQARLIHETPGRPTGYFIELEPWTRLLNLDSSDATSVQTSSALPGWRFWLQLFAFLSHASHWVRTHFADRLSTYVLSSQARDLYQVHQQAFTLNGISLPQPERYKGEEYLEGFHLTLRNLSKWMTENL